MNWLKNVTYPLAERARSPLYGSFVVSWLIWNWRIVLSVIFFSTYDLEGKNLPEFIIDKYLNYWDGLFFPAVLAALYIYVIPWADYWIFNYSEKIKRKKIDKKIEIGKEHFVEGNLYYDLQLALENEKSKVINFDKEIKESQVKVVEKENEIRTLNTDTEKVKNELIDVQKKYSQLSNRHNISQVFSGRWRLVYTGPDKSGGSEDINFVGNSYQIVDANGTIRDRFKIKLFDFDIENKKLSFVKYLPNPSPGEGHCINELNMISMERFEGKENDTTTVVYTKTQI